MSHSENNNPNPLSVAATIKRADDRLYRTLMFAPLIARLVYATCVAVVAITGFVLETRWDIHAMRSDIATKADAATVERNAKLVDQIYKAVFKQEPPPR